MQSHVSLQKEGNERSDMHREGGNGRRNKKRFGVAGLENCNDVAENQGMLATIRS